MNEWGEQSASAPATQGFSQDEAKHDDMDKLFEASIDHQDAAKTERELIKPAGSYMTQGDLSLRSDVVKPGERNAGRVLFSYFGKAIHTVKDEADAALHHAEVGAEITGYFRFTLSPTRCYWTDNDGNPTQDLDDASKLWPQALRAYEQVAKEKAQSVGQVVEFVRDTPLVLRVIQSGVPTERNPEPKGQPRNKVVAITAPRGEV